MINYNIDDNGILKIYYDNTILCEISDCKNSDEDEINDIIYEELENKLEELENDLEYRNKEMEVCGYGKRELEEVACLENTITEIHKYLYKEV